MNIKERLRRVEDFFKSIFVRCLSLLFASSGNVPLNLFAVKKILVIRQHDQLGDMLCVIPLLRFLRNKFPDAFITLVASPVNYKIMKYHPYVDDVLNYDKQGFLSAVEKGVDFLDTIRRKQYDLAIVPVTVSVSVTSDFLAMLSGAKIRIGAKSLQGAKSPTSFCFTHPVDLDWRNNIHRHQSLRNLDIIQTMNPNVDNLDLVLGISEEENKTAIDFLKKYRDTYKLMIGFHPGAGKKENQWDAKRFASVANRLCRENNAFAVITSGPMDADAVQNMKQNLTVPYVCIENFPIREVAAIINNLDIFLSNDTGIMHIAGATKTPLVSLFGPTDALQWAPQGKKNRYIISSDNVIDSISEETVYLALFEMIQQIPG